jgi:Helix-destabilising protein
VKITLADGAAAWPAGVYTVDDASYYVGGFGELALGRLVLKAATAAVPRAASA